MENKYGTTVQQIKCWNGSMVKPLYSPLSAVSLLAPSDDGDWYHFSPLLASVSIFLERVFSEWYRFNCLNVPWSPPTPFDYVSQVERWIRMGDFAQVCAIQFWREIFIAPIPIPNPEPILVTGSARDLGI